MMNATHVYYVRMRCPVRTCTTEGSRVQHTADAARANSTSWNAVVVALNSPL